MHNDNFGTIFEGKPQNLTVLSDHQSDFLAISVPIRFVSNITNTQTPRLISSAKKTPLQPVRPAKTPKGYPEITAPTEKQQQFPKKHSHAAYAGLRRKRRHVKIHSNESEHIRRRGCRKY